MIIIPAIDIVNGQCVRLSQGDFARKKVYAENPLDVARAFEEGGLKYLHLVDLDGAKEGKVKNWNVIESIIANTKLKVDFGGGIKTEAEIDRLLNLGVGQVNLGSIAVKQPSAVKDWIKKFGSDKIILSADSNNEMLAIAGWQDQTTVSVIDFIKDFMLAGLEYATCTDIAKDGMMSGSNIDLYRKILKEAPNLKLIASGGVTSIDEVHELDYVSCYGCIIGKAIYEGTLTLDELSAL